MIIKRNYVDLIVLLQFRLVDNSTFIFETFSRVKLIDTHIEVSKVSIYENVRKNDLFSVKNNTDFTGLNR